MTKRTVQIGKLTIVIENVDEDISDEELKKMVWFKLIQDNIEINKRKVLAEETRMAS